MNKSIKEIIVKILKIIFDIDSSNEVSINLTSR